MKKLPRSALIHLLLILLASSSRADDYSQDFNTWPFTGIGSPPWYLPLFPTTTNDGWVANEASVAGDSDPDPSNYIPSPYSAPRAAWLKDLRTGGNPWILSPLLSEGAGLVTFYARGSKSSAYQQRFTVDTSTNAVNWTTRASFTNSTVSWTQYSIKLDIYEPVYVRIRKTYDGNIAALYLGIDDISITRPTPFLLITNVTLTPSSPTINDPVQVQATIVPYAGAHTITPTVLWRSTSSAAYSEVTMSTSGSNVYHTAGGGIPAQAIGGNAVEYYIRAEFQGGTPGVHTNFYPAAAPATRLRYVVQPLSAYPQMNITGTATTNMQLVSNYQWQGRLSGTMSSPSFLFSSGSESWGDSNPTKTTLPVYGLAESNAPAIAITETVTNHLAFLFQDDSLQYGIQKSQVAHFDNWSTGGSYVATPTIQPDGWQINGAKVAPTTDFENWRQFSGKYLILKYGEGGGTQYLRSPYLPEGAGTLSFRYRHFDDPGSSSAGFKVQVSETETGTWSDVSEVTNIVSLGYLYFSVNIADRRAKYVRVLNHPSVATSWLCLDEIILTYPGATVDLGNPTRNTDNPMVDESVRVSIDATAIYENATNLTCSVFVRPSNSTVFAEVPMVRSNDTFYAWIPPGPKGPMYYYFRCTFDGFGAGSVVYPFGGPLTPLSYVISQQFGPERQQNFNAWPYTGNSGSYPRFTTSTNLDWVANDAAVGGRNDNFFLPDNGYSTPRAAWLNALNLGGSPWVQSPLLSGGISTVYVYCRNTKNTPQTFVVETWAPGFGDWVVRGSAISDSTTWQLKAIPVNVEETAFVRIRKSDDQGVAGQWLGLDDITISYPPADVVVTNVHFTKAYPSRAENVTVSCLAVSKNPNFPAFGISPKVYHRQGSGAWNITPMTHYSGNEYRATLPTYDTGTVSFFIRCDFSGYFFSVGSFSENRSPAFSPYAPPTASEPSTFYAYSVREYSSNFQSLSVTGTVATTMHLVGDDLWQGIINLPPTNRIELSILGSAYRLWNDDAPLTFRWGDAQQWQERPPIVSGLDLFATNIVVTGELQGQYLVRSDLNTGQYIVHRCNWQDFNQWLLHADKFAAGSAGGVGQIWGQNFDAWAADVTDVITQGFEGTWTNFIDRWYTSIEDEEGWVMKDFRIVNRAANHHRAALMPQANVGYIRPANSILLDGAGSISFWYRATETNVYPILYANGYSWTNYTLNADITARLDNTITNNDDGCYHSIFYRYMDANNYYEYRLSQTNRTSLVAELWKCKAGVKTRLYKSGAIGGGYTLDSGGTWRVIVTNQTSQINSQLYYQGNRYINYNDTDLTLWKGTFGFGAYDANMYVRGVDATYNNKFTYSEGFDAVPAPGWVTNTFWTISVANSALQRVGRGSDPLGYKIALCSDQYYVGDEAYWRTFTNRTNLRNLHYTFQTINIQTSETVFVIIKHTDGNGSLRFDDITLTDWHGRVHGSAAATNWYAPDTWVVSAPVLSAPRSLELRSSRALDPRGYTQYIRSPLLTTVGPLVFRYYTTPGDPPAQIELQWAHQANPTLWEKLEELTLSSAGAWMTWSYPANIASNGYIRLAHVSRNPKASIIIDDFEIYDYHAADTNSWIAYNALITPNQTDKLFRASGQSCYLNYNDRADILSSIPYSYAAPYLQTPYLPAGIGEISFWYRNWPIAGGASFSRLKIEVSPDGQSGTWQTIFTKEISNTSYQYLSLNRYDPSNHYVRISNVTNAPAPDRLCLDEVLVVAPLATDIRITNVHTVPEVPLYTDSVKLRADLTDFILGPDIQNVEAYYHVGTNNWANWPEEAEYRLPMQLISSNMNVIPPVYTYETVGTIPAKPIDSVVQYLIKVTFTGQLNPEYTSPKRFGREFVNPSWYAPVDLNLRYGTPTRKNAYYIVFSCPPGAVWVNELNVDQYDEPYGGREYIELCGRSGSIIANWRLNVVDTVLRTNQSYLITQNTTLRDQVNGFGFWVLGDCTNTIPADQCFTNTPDSYGYNLPLEGGIQLMRSMGAVEHAVSYNVSGWRGPGPAMAMTNFGYIYIGGNDYSLQSPLALTNAGSEYADFQWSNDTGPMSYTPGTVNQGQTLYRNEPPPEISIRITDLVLGPTNAAIIFEVTGTNEILPTVWYATNLLEESPWKRVTNSVWACTNGLCTQWFEPLPEVPACFYRITAPTNGP